MNWLRVMVGGICGVVATGPMTAAMVLWHRRLPFAEKYPLPPREITGAVFRRAGVAVTAEQAHAASILAHFAYGGAAGGLYGMLPGAHRREALTSGIGLGFFVWSLSYFGLLPALRILRPATTHPMRRNALMLGAHFIWGTVLCLLHELLLADGARVAPALRMHAHPPRDVCSGNLEAA